MAQLKHTPPNFTVNSIKGWNTRLLYTFYGYFNTAFNYYAVATNYTNNLFSTIANWENSNAIIVSKGQYNYPQYSYFFKTGKSIRVKGHLLVTSDDTNQIFNIFAKIRNITDNSLISIASSDKSNSHTFANGTIVNGLPINFEITYSCVEDNNDLYFQANGFFQYEYDSYSGGGTNRSVVYVPIWSDNQFTLVGTNDDEYNLYISFDDSNVPNITLRHMTVEELS